MEIVRTALRRERARAPWRALRHPFGNGTGLGKPPKLMARPLRSEIPIYIAAMSPKGVEQACEIADGWLPIFWSPSKAGEVFGPALAATGTRLRRRPERAGDLVDDVEAGRDFLKPCSRSTSAAWARAGRTSTTTSRRYGYEEAAEEIQDLYLDGNKRDAAALVPDAFVDEVAPHRPEGASRRASRRLARVGRDDAARLTEQPEALRALAELAL